MPYSTLQNLADGGTSMSDFKAEKVGSNLQKMSTSSSTALKLLPMVFH